MDKPRYAIVLHAGAGESWIGDAASRKATESFLQSLVEQSKESLRAGRPAVDVVADAVAALEDYPDFNAGKGAAVNDDGFHELEAGIMDGATGQYRAAGCLRRVKNPVRLARAMLDSQSSHVFLVGQPGDDLARARGLDVVDNEYFTTPKRRDFWLSKKKPQQQQKVDEHGTVGAVALDLHGNLATANSTGGMMFKHTGRMGDTAIVGAGLYADKDVAIACSGGGEAILQVALASKIVQEKQAGKDLSEAIVSATTKATALFPQLSCGVVAVDQEGTMSIHCNSRIFATASGGGGGEDVPTPTWAGISRCTIPVIEPLLLFDDDVARAGFAKHPTMANQVIFTLKQPIHIGRLDRNLVTRVFRRIRLIARLLIEHSGAVDCGISMKNGQEVMLFPVHQRPTKPSLFGNKGHPPSNCQKFEIEGGCTACVLERPLRRQLVSHHSLQVRCAGLFCQDETSFLSATEALCTILESAPSKTATLNIPSWTLTMDPWGDAADLAKVTFFSAREEQDSWYPAPAPFHAKYPGYLSPELGPRLGSLAEVMKAAELMAAQCSQASSCLVMMEKEPSLSNTDYGILLGVGRHVFWSTYIGAFIQRMYTAIGDSHLPLGLGLVYASRVREEYSIVRG